MKQPHCSPICAIPNNAAAQAPPLTSLQHRTSARLAGRTKILPMAAMDERPPSRTHHGESPSDARREMSSSWRLRVLFSCVERLLPNLCIDIGMSFASLTRMSLSSSARAADVCHLVVDAVDAHVMSRRASSFLRVLAPIMWGKIIHLK